MPDRKNSGGPFPAGSGGCRYFRIPALWTLDDGRLLAASDARWNHVCDGANLDTVVSSSGDGGRTWESRFANYFGDSEDKFSQYAASFIDPALVQGKDGTVYLLTDVWPGSVALNIGPNRPEPGSSGYLDADGDGEAELVLYDGPGGGLGDFGTDGAAWRYRPEEYSCYVGEFGEDGFAPIWGRSTAGKAETLRGYADRWYYLYDSGRRPVLRGKLAASSTEDIRAAQPPEVSEEQVHANVFFYNSPLRVWPASYLWLTASGDGGLTWSAPLILNPQVRRDEDKDIWFYGAGPGRGLRTSDGRVLFACYTQVRGMGDGRTSVISSSDGVTWQRSREVPVQSSEAALAEADGRIYLFARHGQVCFSRDGGVTWQPINCWPEGLYRDCQISAITYSRLIGGRRTILLSGPCGTDRVNGKIWVGFAGKDTIEWEREYEVTGAQEKFAYSCLTELPDGSVGLLYESGKGAETFLRLRPESLGLCP